MENLKPFKRGKINVVEPFESNPHNAPKIERFSISKSGKILMLHINDTAYGYFITE